MDAHRGGADERGDVGGDALLHQVVQIFAERRPGDGELDVALPVELILQAGTGNGFAMVYALLFSAILCRPRGVAHAQ